MKKILLLLFILYTLGLKAQNSMPEVSLFLNFGQSIPVGSYSSSSSSSNPVAIGKASPFANSYNCGLDLYFHSKLGASLGFSVSGFDLDNVSFEKAHTNNLQYSDSYLRNHVSGRLYAGLTTRFSFNRLNLEPRINAGITSFNFEFADFYQGNAESDILKTLSYDYETPMFISFNAGVNARYEIAEVEGLRFGLQFFSEISYQKPEVKYEKTESDKQAGTYSVVTESYKQNIMFIYYGIGLVLKVSGP